MAETANLSGGDAMQLNSIRVIAAMSVVFVAACAPEPKAPDLSTLYNSAAELAQSQDRRPVISIPGTLGSRLLDEDSGIYIWGADDGLGVDPADPANARLIALPIAKGDEPLKSLKDNVRPDGVLRVARASILGVPLELDVYQGVISTLIAGGFDFRETREEEIAEREINLDSFEFPYDWRRDIVEAAQDLDYFIQRKTEQVMETRREVFGPNVRPVKFDLVAHSMGTLVARYYLMYGAAPLPEDGSLPEVTWAGAKNIDTVVFIAPPNTGSVLSFENLVNGKELGPLQPYYQPALLGTQVSVYQLFPRTRHRRVWIKGQPNPVNLFDVENWDRYGWGLLDPDQDEMLQTLMPEEPDAAARRARARNHLKRVLDQARYFQDAMDRQVDWPPGLHTFLVVGGGFNTPAEVTYDPETGEAEVTKFEEGDGVVLRASSLLDERQDGQYMLRLRSPLSFRSVLLLPEEHVDITKSPVFGDNLLFWLLEGQRAGDSLIDPSRPPPKARDFQVAADAVKQTDR